MGLEIKFGINPEKIRKMWKAIETNPKAAHIFLVFGEAFYLTIGVRPLGNRGTLRGANFLYGHDLIVGTLGAFVRLSVVVWRCHMAMKALVLRNVVTRAV